MKNIFLLSILAFALLTGCGDDFLNKENLYEKDLDNYYSNEADVDEALVGAYSCLAVDEGRNHPMLIANIQSDDCFAGGGSTNQVPEDIDKFTNEAGGDSFLHIYERCYQGIFRINTLLEKFDNVTYTDEKLAKQQKGEAQFLRAFFYFRLAHLFGEVPLQLESGLQYLPKSDAAAIYAQITTDLKAAIENLPNDKYTATWASTNSGRATKWAAQGLMARVYLFYTGYYKQAALPLNDGSSVTKAEVVSWLNSCIDESGHDLLADYSSVWPYSFLNDTWAQDGHIETVFAVKYTNQGIWSTDGRTAYCNQMCLYIGMRGAEYPPYGQGWGFAQVSPKLKEAMNGDPRLALSVIDVDTDVSGYEYGIDRNHEETGLYNKKYNPIVADDGEGNVRGMYYNLYGGLNANMQLWNMQDDIILRFSDILLMQSELTGDATGIDRVRARVGLASVGAGLDVIKKERQSELAFEGVRYYDLLRWGDAKVALEAANGQPMKNSGVDGTYNVTFNPDRAFLPLPESQIRLSEGQLTQNPGWE
ncbi:RagB/SusD family nutrient uptake outer membrane protein [Ancylomarina sp. 16SWW S1-10-2]|uniref:RagB/SusD family nutrient uptake outer membrane protein n=1 Tax=Ancylomarina sp. 16SWW S1-10-2 TaxID=2499681 RepID=UPI0012AD74F6|nr:RagB/SusD family nutrient uptake outer membrane protein [Ancylomarina sp. 16SWW S1-10-2]MRT92053.1 RagB/SusD family nutrient uptake outer membrane protein [Ancylomarina sp. 16SWW S1-10-2]